LKFGFVSDFEIRASGFANPRYGDNSALFANVIRWAVWRSVLPDSSVAAYRDGVLANSETNAVGVLLNTHVVNNLGTAGSLPFRVGAQNEANGDRSGAAAPSMTVAKLRVYDLALTAQQIADTYNTERVQFPGQPKITNVRVNPNNGFVSFDWVPAPAKTYAVERSSDLSNPLGWSTIATGQTSGSFTNDPAGAPMNHYRLRVE
jgi:hypothetical protein